MYYKRSSQIIAVLQEIAVSECNGDVRISIGSHEISVCTKFAKTSPERLARRQAASSCNAFAIATFSSI